MFPAGQFQLQVSSNLTQLSTFLQTIRQSSSSVLSSFNGRTPKHTRAEVTAAYKKPSEVLEEKKIENESHLEDETGPGDQDSLVTLLPLLTDNTFWKLVPIAIAESCKCRNAHWGDSHVSASTFFENKTGFSERFLLGNAPQSYGLLLQRQMNKMQSPMHAAAQQRRAMTQGFGMSQRLSKKKKTDESSMDYLLKNEKSETKMKISAAFAVGFRRGQGASASPASTPSWLRLVNMIRTATLVAMLCMLLVILVRFVYSSSQGSLKDVLTGKALHEINPEEVNVKFSDVKGCDDAKEELSDIVTFLKDKEKFKNMGAKLPKGVLLNGPPGTGKTLLARATAGEAGVPFFYTSGSEFDEIFVGSGAKKVRQLFQEANARAPCIIFIDEIDSVGGKRTNSGLHPYANQTVNQLLSEMDGFSPSSGVIIIGATNKRDNLDSALLRPGRFDMEVNIRPPDQAGRKELLELYLGQVKAATDIDVDVLAKVSNGMTGADIQALINNAAILAVKTGSFDITMSLLLEATDNISMGPAWKSRKINKESKWNTAYHECGHALVAFYTKDALPLHKITILARGQSLGHTAFLPETDSYSETKSELLARIDTAMGGRAGEELKYGKDNVTTGASSDFERATSIATNMVAELGMSDKVGKRIGQGKHLGPEWKSVIDSEVNKILQDSYDRALTILKTHSDEFERLASALYEYETLDVDEVKLVIKGKPITRKPKKLTNGNNNTEEKGKKAPTPATPLV